MGKLENKVAIVTGSTSGIGEAIAKLFAKEGCKVVVHGLNNEKEKAAAERIMAEIKADGGTATYVLSDLAGDDSNYTAIVDKAIETYGQIDILCNNAGIVTFKTIVDESIEKWNLLMKVNVTAAFKLSQLVAPYMKKLGKGAIVNTSSASGLVAHNSVCAYVASKHAIAGLTKSSAFELGPEIRVNGIAPNCIMTPMLQNCGGEEAYQSFVEACPLKRLGRPEDVAKVVLFLASDDASFVNGDIIKIDGGYEC